MFQGIDEISNESSSVDGDEEDAKSNNVVKRTNK